MREVEFFKWWMPPEPPWHKKRWRTHWMMNRETAAERGALEPDISTREVRHIPETDEEIEADCTGSGMARFARERKP